MDMMDREELYFYPELKYKYYYWQDCTHIIDLSLPEADISLVLLGGLKILDIANTCKLKI